MFINKFNQTKRIISLITLTAYLGTADLAYAGRTKFLPKGVSQDSDEQPKRSKPLPPKEKEELSASDIEDSDQDVRRFFEEDAEVQEWVNRKRQRPQEEEQSNEDQPGMVEVLGHSVEEEAQPNQDERGMVEASRHPVQEVGFPQFFEDRNMQEALALQFARNLNEQPYIFDGQPFYTNLALTCKATAKIVSGVREHLRKRALLVLYHNLDGLHDGIPAVRDLGWNPFGLTFDDLFLDLQDTKGRDELTIFGRLVGPVLENDEQGNRAFVHLFPLLQQAKNSQRNFSPILQKTKEKKSFWKFLFHKGQDGVDLHSLAQKLADVTEDFSQVNNDTYIKLSQGAYLIIISLLKTTDFEDDLNSKQMLTNVLYLYANILRQRATLPAEFFNSLEGMVKCALRSGLVSGGLSLKVNDKFWIGDTLLTILETSSFNHGIQLLSLLTSIRPDIASTEFFIDLMNMSFTKLKNFKPEEVDNLDFVAFTRVINVFNKLYDESKIVKNHRKAKKQANEFKGWDIYEVCCKIMSVPFESRTPALTTFAETIVNLPMVMNSSRSPSFGLKKGYSWFSYLVQNAAGHDFISLVFTNFIRNMEKVNPRENYSVEEFNRYIACLKKEDTPYLKTDVFGKPLPFYCTKRTSLRVILDIERDGVPLFDLSERDARGNSILVEACSRNDTKELVPFIKFILPKLKEKLPNFKKEANSAINVLKAFEGQKKGKIRDSIIEMLKEAKKG